MADGKIAWTDTTWNPIRGCTRVSEGCRHCYAERVAGRFSGPGQPYEGLVDAGLTDDYARTLVGNILPSAIRAARGDAEIDRIAAGGDPQ